MPTLVVLGAGTGGTTLVNKLRPRLGRDWSIILVEPSAQHHYQPGYLFVPFGKAHPQHLVKPTARFVPAGVELVRARVEEVLVDDDVVLLDNGRRLPYDYLVIATGVAPRPDLMPGLTDPSIWRVSAHEFYTLEGAVALRESLRTFDHGRIVVHVAEMPVKCPVAPLEFAFLVEDWLREGGIRDQVEIVYATPLSSAFTKPVAAARLGHLLGERKIHLEPDFVVERVDPAARELVSYDERRIPFDLLVTVPVNLGADFVARSGLGDEMNYVTVDRGTLRSTRRENIFAVGDAADLPTSKAGSVAHFAVDVLADNLVELTQGRAPSRRFDGHANCYVESGEGKALLIDFNYDVEPLPGVYPWPVIGPFRLLQPTRPNHWGKLAFRWVYWHVLLRGRKVPVPTQMSMTGKSLEAAEKEV
jgi:sulfide:quinone oxidoreductase